MKIFFATAPALHLLLHLCKIKAISLVSLLTSISTVLEIVLHLGVLQYLNKQTAALREVNDSRLKIYEQVSKRVIQGMRRIRKISDHLIPPAGDQHQ